MFYGVLIGELDCDKRLTKAEILNTSISNGSFNKVTASLESSEELSQSITYKVFKNNANVYKTNDTVNK